MLKFDMKKYLSYDVLRKVMMFCLVTLLCACSEEEGMGEGKETNYASQSSCWQTKILDATLKIVDNLFSTSAGKVASGGAAIVMIAFSIWVAFKLLKVLASFKEENVGEVLTEIGHKLFLCSFCALCVRSVGDITWAVNTFVVPIYSAFLELASGVLNISSSATFNLGDAGSATFSNAHASDCGVNPNFNVSGGIKSTISPMANCITCSISSRLNAGLKIGLDLICSLNFAAMFVGLALIVFFTVAKFGFVLFIIDSIFRINFAVVLIPIMIMGVPFGFTRKWSVHCLLMFVNSSAIMLFIGLLVSLSVNALETIMNNIGPKITFASISGTGELLLALLMISMLLLNIPGLGVGIADKFVGGGGDMEFQKKISKFVENTGKKIRDKALSSLTYGLSTAITTPLEKYEQTREKVDAIKQTASKIQSRLDSLAGYDDD